MQPATIVKQNPAICHVNEEIKSGLNSGLQVNLLFYLDPTSQRLLKAVTYRASVFLVDN